MPTSHTTVRTPGATSRQPKLSPWPKKGQIKGAYMLVQPSSSYCNILSFVIFAFSGTPPAQEVMSVRVTLRMRSPTTLTSWSSEWKTVRRRWPRKRTKFLKKVRGLPSKPKLTPLPKIPLPLRVKVKVKVKMEQRQLRRRKSPNPGYQFYLVGVLLW